MPCPSVVERQEAEQAVRSPYRVGRRWRPRSPQAALPGRRRDSHPRAPASRPSRRCTVPGSFPSRQPCTERRRGAGSGTGITLFPGPPRYASPVSWPPQARRGTAIVGFVVFVSACLVVGPGVAAASRYAFALSCGRGAEPGGIHTGAGGCVQRADSQVGSRQVLGRRGVAAGRGRRARSHEPLRSRSPTTRLRDMAALVGASSPDSFGPGATSHSAASRSSTGQPSALPDTSYASQFSSTMEAFVAKQTGPRSIGVTGRPRGLRRRARALVTGATGAVYRVTRAGIDRLRARPSKSAAPRVTGSSSQEGRSGSSSTRSAPPRTLTTAQLVGLAAAAGFTPFGWIAGRRGYFGLRRRRRRDARARRTSRGPRPAGPGSRGG